MYRHAAVVLALLVPLVACGGSDEPEMRTTLFGGDRPVQLKTPATLTPGKQYPLIVLLHGIGTTGFAQSAYFHLRTLVEGDHAMYIAPDGTVAPGSGRQFWNADPACCDFENQNPDDVGYLGTLVEDILATWPEIDTDAVFFIGHSNGGYMSYRMACERADLIAGIVSLAGNAQTNAAGCTPARHVAVLHLHGTLDDRVPYESGLGTGAEGSTNQWASKNGCGTTRASSGSARDLDTLVAGAETEPEAYGGCPADGAVELWRMEGSSHTPLFDTPIATTLLDWLVEHRR
jgi:polyhydroxybutyrate depolymerase